MEVKNFTVKLETLIEVYDVRINTSAQVVAKVAETKCGSMDIESDKLIELLSVRAYLKELSELRVFLDKLEESKLLSKIQDDLGQKEQQVEEMIKKKTRKRRTKADAINIADQFNHGATADESQDATEEDPFTEINAKTEKFDF